jgi:hypothetical protein
LLLVNALLVLRVLQPQSVYRAVILVSSNISSYGMDTGNQLAHPGRFPCDQASPGMTAAHLPSNDLIEHGNAMERSISRRRVPYVEVTHGFEA